jgi:hypothetical protein
VVHGRLPADLAGVHVDHIIPVAAGGPDEEWNFQVLHGPCNRAKRNTITAEAFILAAEHGIELAPAGLSPMGDIGGRRAGPPRTRRLPGDNPLYHPAGAGGREIPTRPGLAGGLPEGLPCSGQHLGDAGGGSWQPDGTESRDTMARVQRRDLS